MSPPAATTQPASAAPRLPILTYHSLDDTGSVISVTPSDFAAHMATLARLNLRGIALRDAVAYRAAHGQWPRASVVLTFDDGYANFPGAALPALRQHGFSATLFAISGYLGGVNAWAPPPPALGTQAILSAAQLRDLAAAGIEIGAHTRTHVDLSRASAAQIEDELAGSRRDLERHLDMPVESFAYPYGNLCDLAVGASRRFFAAACTTTLARAADDDLHLLPRLDMYYLRAPTRLARALSGGLDWYLTLRRWARAARRFTHAQTSNN